MDILVHMLERGGTVKGKSFLRQLCFSYLMIAVVPLVLLMAFLFFRTFQASRATLQERMDTEAELTLSQFASQYASLSFISIDLVGNQDFLRAAQDLSSESSSPLARQLAYTRIETFLCAYAIASSDYDVVYFNDLGYYATSAGNNHGYTWQYRLDEAEEPDLVWMEQIRNNYGQSLLLPVGAGLLPQIEEQVLALVRMIRNPGKPVGVLAVYTKTENLSYILESARQFGAELLICGEDQELLYASSGFPAGSCMDEEGKLCPGRLRPEYLAAGSTDEATGLSIWIALSMRSVYLQSLKSILPLLLEGLLLLAAVGLVVAFYSRRLTAPLVALTAVMRKTTITNLRDNSDPGIFAQYQETDYLYEQFRDMRLRLDDMVQREIVFRTLQTQERLNALQAQIHPHFLYNTLNVIGIMGMEEGNDRIYDSCLRLSSLLRYSISDGHKNTAALRDEIENTRSYLELMKLRYEHRFLYTLEAAPGLGDVKTPRLILQPFAENIFEHAYDENHTTVRASIMGCVRDGRWYLVVEDDGAGMPEQVIAALEKDVEESCRDIRENGPQETWQGIGIRNTLIRMSLFFGPSFSYSITNRCEGGTRIVLSSEMGEDA